VIRIGSRGSQLALWQANHIAKLLRDQGHKVEIEIIRTTGDRLQSLTFAEVGTVVSKGIFTLEIEQALEAGRIDLAVHSLKDLPTSLSEPFTLGAIPVRADARDVLVCKDYASFTSLPPGAKIGTSSLRRQSQLRHLRPDLDYIEFRGNVDTRLRKLAEGQATAIILAAAGLDRLEKTDWIRERIAPEIMCPAAGQGALGIEIRKGDQRVADAIAFMDDPSTRFRVTAERVALAALGGGCQVPIGVHCRSQNQRASQDSVHHYKIIGVVADPAGTRIVHSSAVGENAAELGLALAADLLQKGAIELLQGIGIH
jgi:hydroxymethylbilane synthase